LIRWIHSEERLLKLEDIDRNKTRDKQLDMKKKMSIIENEMEHEIMNKAAWAFKDLNWE